jgi:hypothetical protein
MLLECLAFLGSSMIEGGRPRLDVPLGTLLLLALFQRLRSRPYALSFSSRVSDTGACGRVHQLMEPVQPTSCLCVGLI